MINIYYMIFYIYIIKRKIDVHFFRDCYGGLSLREERDIYGRNVLVLRRP